MVQQKPDSFTPLVDPGERLFVEGDVAIVTGAAGGIGRYVAFELAAAGAEVALVDRDGDGLNQVRTAIYDKLGQDPSVEVTDVTDESSVQTMVSNVVDQHGSVDILANIAGVMTMSDPGKLALDAWNLVLNVNLTGTFLCCRETFPHLKNGGRIVNIASTAGVYGYRHMAHYAAAKSGLMNLTRSLASAWAPVNIRVNAIAPGLIYTDFTAEQFDVDADSALDRQTIDREVGAPTEIADTVLFLAAPMSSYMTGETLTVEGPPPDQADIFSMRDN